MNLISCDNCGVVLDGEKLDFPKPEDIDKAQSDANRADDIKETIRLSRLYEEMIGWDGDQYVPKTKCPICKGEVLKK